MFIFLCFVWVHSYSHVPECANVLTMTHSTAHLSMYLGVHLCSCMCAQSLPVPVHVHTFVYIYTCVFRCNKITIEVAKL